MVNKRKELKEENNNNNFKEEIKNYLKNNLKIIVESNYEYDSKYLRVKLYLENELITFDDVFIN
jgi:hypothetical protein